MIYGIGRCQSHSYWEGIGSAHLAKVSFTQTPLIEDHVNRSTEYDETMTNIAEHDCEEERERNDREKSRVDLLIFSDTVTVHDGLEGFSEFIRPVERGWCLVRLELVENGWNTGP